MKYEIVELNCPIFGDFKVGENTVYNSHVLCSLVDPNEGGKFNEPIILQIASIIEVCLEEIFYRAKKFNREGVPNISEEDRQNIAEKQIDKLAVIIDNAKRYHILDELGDKIYQRLHELRRLRNKIHIHLDVEGAASRDEASIFTHEAVVWVITLLWEVLSCIAVKYPRPEGIGDYVRALRLPRAMN